MVAEQLSFQRLWRKEHDELLRNATLVVIGLQTLSYKGFQGSGKRVHDI